MWIADQWKDYEVLDTSERGKTGALGRLSPGAAGPPGDLEYAEETIRAGGK